RIKTNNAERMVVTAGGKVGIGIDATNMPGSYKLYVADGILAEKVKVAVKTTTNWADFVFDENYKRMSLSELENFISNNKHLPELPCAEDVVANGADLGEIQSALLQKIEELTLYVIEQNKRIEQLEKLAKK